MLGIIGIIASLTVLGLSLLITRIATTALTLTGMSREAAKFQARSAFTGTGFTTAEAEKVVNHPVRRKIIMSLMIARSAGLISIIISLILSFGTNGEDEFTRLFRLGWLFAGIIFLWLIARSKHAELWLGRLIKKALNRWTDLETSDFTELLKLTGDYSVREMQVGEDDWLADKKLEECRLRDEGVQVIGIYRSDGGYVGAPMGDTKIHADDNLILYGREKTLNNLDERKAGVKGEAEHKEAAREQRKEQATQPK